MLVIVLAPAPSGPDGRFPDFRGGMYLGGQVRLEAAAKLILDDPSIKLVLVGGRHKPQDMAKFLRARSKSANLHLVPSLPCTYHNFVAVFDDWIANNIEIGEAGILTNAYHLERALLLANQASAQIDPPIRFVPMPAEEILGATAETIVGHRLEEYTLRTKIERQGLTDARLGTYTDSCTAAALPAAGELANMPL